MSNVEIFSEVGRDAYIKLLTLWEKMPKDRQYYLLGYMQSEADKNIQQKANV